MKIRGERECQECGTRWSYYETGSIGCPGCESLKSVGIDDRTEHTDFPTQFDLTPVRTAVDDVSTTELAERAREITREYIRQRGFISGGTLEPLDDTFLAGAELVHLSDVIARKRDILDEEELYFLELLRGADVGERPPPEKIPHTLHGARGLAYANAIREYRRDIRTWADDQTLVPDERSALEILGEHVTRIRMLDGDVESRTAETLVAATRDLATALRTDDSAALESARNHLDGLELQ